MKTSASTPGDRPMKIIEAMKKIKDLQQKLDDIKGKVALHCANMNYETPVYGDDQKKQVDEWLQSASDILKEILELRVRIQVTNLATQVTIELGGKQVTKSIAAWIHRRRDLAKSEQDLWERMSETNLTNVRRLKEGRIKDSSQQERDVTIRRYFEPVKREEKVELFRSEPSKIDATLEVVNATIDLL
jgi:hypothetical protein